MSRLTLTHEERAISVISGPYGIGKSRTLEAFATAREGECVIVEVEPGSTKKGMTQGGVMQRVVEALRPLRGRSARAALSNSTWTLRQMVYDSLCELFGEDAHNVEYHPRFTIIFDEAQYLSAEAIEMLRFWNDGVRSAAPFPVGLFFVGNSEFALETDRHGQSVLSGAVRSRALFIEQLSYDEVSDVDLTLFLQSRGVADAGAINAVTQFYAPQPARRDPLRIEQRMMRRDLRQLDKLVTSMKRRAGDLPVTAEIVRSVLSA